MAEAAVAPDHGGLVDDEDRAFAGVRSDGGRCAAVGSGFAQVDAAVDGTGLEAGIAAHHLGGAAGRCEKLCRSAQVAQDPDEGGHRGRLARSGVAPDDETTAGLGAGKEPPERVHERSLTVGRRRAERLPAGGLQLLLLWEIGTR